MRLDLCNSLELGIRKVKSLFDYGYHLILIHQFEEAIEILTEHYDLIIKENLLDKEDMSLIHATLSFVHWYNGDFGNAIQLLGLFIISSYERNTMPVISVIEEDGMIDKFDILSFFKKRMYI